MSSPFVLSNFALQLLKPEIATRFRLYLAVFNPVQMQVQSQDLGMNALGQPTLNPDLDLLANHVAPYAPQPNFGSNRIGFVGEPLFFDGSRSTQRANLSATDHLWSASGSPSVTTYVGPNNLPDSQAQITWSSPGQYQVNLSVSDRFGSTTTGSRQVMIYADRASAPPGVLGVSQISGSIANGGWTASVSTTAHMLSILRPDALPIGAYQPVTLLCEVEYEVTPGNWRPVQTGPYGAPVPGQWYEDPRILFSGYIISGAAAQTADVSQQTFQLGTIDTILKLAGVHNIGYYQTSYATWSGNTPTSLNPSKVGVGQRVADLSSEDVYRSLLLDHCTVGLHHDVFVWREFLPQSTTNASLPSVTFGSANSSGVSALTSGQLYQLSYSNLSVSEGSIWQGLSQIAMNEYASVWVERDSSIRIGPQLAMRGYELLAEPTAYPALPLAQVLNFTTELRGNATLGSQVSYLHFLFGPNALPQAQEQVGGYRRDLSALVGPPVAFHISDTPIYDTGPAPADPALLPWVSANWPQDLAITPMQMSVPMNYAGRDAFVKLIAVLVNSANQASWAAWYPSTIFSCAGLLQQSIPAGQWQVLGAGAGTSTLIPDVTVASSPAAKALAWQYLWELARRIYYAQNKSYDVTISLGLFPHARLNDLFLVTRQRAVDGPAWNGHPFTTQAITYTINLDQQTWTTELQASEVTAYLLQGPMATPTCPVPT